MAKYDPPSEPPDGAPCCRLCDTPMLDGYAGLNVRQTDWYCQNENCPLPQEPDPEPSEDEEEEKEDTPMQKDTCKTCKNCGAWEGLHHYETNQCPHNGPEAPVGKEQLWDATTYQEDNDLLARVEALEAQVARLLDAVPSAGVPLCKTCGFAHLESEYCTGNFQNPPARQMEWKG